MLGLVQRERETSEVVQRGACLLVEGDRLVKVGVCGGGCAKEKRERRWCRSVVG